MRYEKTLSSIAADDVRAAQLIAECAELRADLESATLAEGEPLLYEQLVELIIRVTDHMLAAHETLRKRVRRAMGGEVLELMRDRAERLEREAEARGIEQGIEQGIERMAASFRAAGIDEATIQAAIEAAQEKPSED